MQYTKGDVRELVRSCLVQQPDEGYTEAKRLIKQYYGNSYAIATLLVDKIINGPIVKSDDAHALQNLAIQLVSYSGSNSTFCKQSLLIDLGYSPDSLTRKNLSLTTLTENNCLTQSYVTNLELSDIEDNFTNELTNVFSRNSLPMTKDDIPRQRNDNHQEPLEIIGSHDDGPYAVRTMFGWVINGPLGDNGRRLNSKNKVFTIKTDVSDDILTRQFESYCNKEFNDRNYDDDVCMSQEDRRALQIMESSVVLTSDSHFQLDLPWKTQPPNLPNNKVVAIHRLRNLRKRSLGEANLFEEYAGFIDKMIKAQFCEMVPEHDLDRRDGMVWYLPHHSVYHPTKKKIRVVFNCSSKYMRVSLNDRLYQGPDLTNSLIGVLIRFRQQRVAFIADVEGMFHQVRVTPSMRDALRFLWWTDRNLNEAATEYRMRVHLFGTTSSPTCSNFALRKTAIDNRSLFASDVADTVLRNFYVDDCLRSVLSVDEGKRLVSQLIQMLTRGGFRLTQFSSNSREVLDTVPESERAKTVKYLNLDSEQLPMERALGILLDMESDQFHFRVKNDLTSKPSTRRGILSAISTLYDPIGFTAPVSLSVKSALQELSRLKLSWDDPIPYWCERLWSEWLKELPKLEDLTISRCFKPADLDCVPYTARLHHFADASEIGYGAVSYIRFDFNGNAHCSFVLGKSRVTPIKTLSIPRLELAAAVLATLLDKMILKELDPPTERSWFWTDSTAVLKYIHNESRRFQVYVANRVSKIREHSSPDQWHFVEGVSNPADDASRGLKPSQLTPSSRWLSGPEFLCMDESSSPAFPDDVNMAIDPSDQELKKSVLSHTIIKNEEDYLLKFVERFSSWHMLKKCVSWIRNSLTLIHWINFDTHKSKLSPTFCRHRQA
ncbi:uncharacterized protein LOC141898922 [Tubulanus polymorphus]|uniref:uncharacterized protein LOC141898922 n=1 Tax=Tubulanus polymorphus TaxID=672921 RepID=UPI003DA4BC59